MRRVWREKVIEVVCRIGGKGQTDRETERKRNEKRGDRKPWLDDVIFFKRMAR